MMKIVYKGGQACPIVVCDWCKDEITDALQGTYAYVMGVGTYPDMEYPAESEIFHVHNGVCYRSFEQYKKVTSEVWLGTIPLQCLPVYMAANLQINWLKAYKDSQFMSGLDGDLTPRMEREAWRILRAEILRRDHYRCEYCGHKATEVDHVLPISRGGTNERTNLVAACYECNRGKRAKTVEEWRNG